MNKEELMNKIVMQPQKLDKEELLKRLEIQTISPLTNDTSVEVIPQMYQMIADEDELRWFFEHVIQKPQVNESYSAVFVSRHKKLTKEEQKTFGLTRELEDLRLISMLIQLH